MKVECATCQARYQIPDERVAGRKLKIRCRKCSGAIIVRGDQLVAPVDETTQQAPPGYASAEWHVSLDGAQHGPYGSAQMASMLRSGQLSWDAHVWRDGYAEWRIAGDSDTLVRAVAAAAGAAEDDGPTRMVHGSAPPDVLQPVARSAFAQRAAQRAQSQPPVVESGHYASQPPFVPEAQYGYENEPAVTVDAQYASQAEYDYANQSNYDYAGQPGYGQENGAADYDGASDYGDYAQPRVSASQAMTGERNEDSVLFSTKNLRATTSSPAIQAPRAGYAGGEGSGLIDIRALAALARTSQAPSPTSRSNGHSNGSNGSNGRAHADEVLALANQTGAFSRLDSLAPFERAAPQSSNAVPLAIVAGSAMVAAAAFLGVYLTRGPAVAPAPAIAPVASAAQPVVAPQAIAAEQPQAEAAEAEPQAAAEDDDQPSEADEGTASAKQEAADQEVKSALRSIRKTRGGKRERMAYAASVARGERSKPEKTAEKAEKAEKASEASAKKSESIDDLLLADSKPEPPKKAEPEPAPEAAAPAKPAATSSRGRSIDDLLDGAVDKGDKKPAAAAATEGGSASGLPETPSRDQVKAAMKAVEGEVKACGDGQTLESPSAIVAISVAGSSGKVSSVRVTGIQGAVGSCVAKAVRGATFPKFSKDTFSINFPFRLK